MIRVVIRKHILFRPNAKVKGESCGGINIAAAKNSADNEEILIRPTRIRWVSKEKSSSREAVRIPTNLKITMNINRTVSGILLKVLPSPSRVINGIEEGLHSIYLSSGSIVSILLLVTAAVWILLLSLLGGGSMLGGG
ncbi:hypothetical protein L6452_21590 [Arctium lappa]|uniref:Uncharacterized protein n=1 Tax=Arctium lappa TaxID=4217 RepID=A0ACB9AWV0_ARCLA|nr:hypothetical protein L6452_21590 [Arctium lappa]